jgi:hypothetical protein
LISLGRRGSRFVDQRVICDPPVLNETVIRNLRSDRNLAAYLGVKRGTARSYRLGHLSLPMRFLEKLQILNPSLRPAKITDAFWGQRKGAHVRWHSSTTSCSVQGRSMRHSQKLREHARRTNALSPDEIEAYDAIPPFSILKVALQEHKPTLAEFVGRILGDGSPIIAPTYSASEIESQKRMQSLVLELFDYKPEIKIAKGNYRMQLRHVCGHTLALLGIPFGRKSVTNPVVPNFIMKSNDRTVWLSFLRGVLDDEAYVSERGIEIGLAVRQMKPDSAGEGVVGSRILDQVSELLNRLEVRHIRRKGQVYRVGDSQVICWFLRIPRREFTKVHALKLFLLPQKQRKLVAGLQK